MICASLCTVLAMPMYAHVSSGYNPHKHLHSAAEQNYPPLCFVSEEQATGFSVDLLKATLDEMGSQVSFDTTLSWNAILKDFKAGSFDVLPLVDERQERKADMDFTVPYLTLHGAIFIREGDRPAYTLDDLSHKTLLVMEGDSAHEFLVNEGFKNLILFDSYASAFKALSQGTGDAIMAQKLMGITLLNELKLTNIQTIGEPIHSFKQRFCFAVKKGDHELLAKLNEGLAIIKSKGIYDDLHTQWLGSLQTGNERLLRVLMLLVGILAGLSIVALAWYTSLKRQVHIRTRELEQQIRKRLKTEERLHLSEQDLEDTRSQFESILDSLDALVYVADMETHEIYFANQYLRKHFGEVQPQSKCYEYLKRNQSEPCDICTNPKLLDAQGQPTGEQVWEMHTKHNNRWYLMRDRAIPWRNGKYVRLEVGMDITSLKKLENELRRTMEAAESGNRAKNTFLATMSHEMRTPLNPIIGLTSILRLNPQAIELFGDELNTIAQAADNMLELINNILDMARIEAERIEVDEIIFNPKHIIKDTTRLFSEDCKRKGLELIISCEDGIPKTLLGAEEQIKQILRNFLANALKFTDQGTLELRVKQMAKTDTSVTLEFSVSDTGIGITKEKINSIFDAFTQADGSPTRSYGGSGLGLTIAKRLAEIIGGDIRVESTPDQGSTFYFTSEFRIYTPHYKASRQLAPVPEIAKDALAHKKILVVDDNPTNTLVLKRMLQTFGGEPHTAANGEEAVAAARQFSYDLIFMDCKMPIMDGYKATTILRTFKNNADATIIAVTAQALQEDLQKCYEVGMDDTLTKPVELDALKQTLSKWL